MYCNHCGNRNPYGSKFCRHCGGGLTAPGAARKIPDTEYALQPEAARPPSDNATRVQQLLDRAFTLSERGDSAGAILACKEAIVDAPSSASAHSFLALLYERSGRIEPAIDEYRIAIKLNPDSTLDRDSLNRLRRKSVGVDEAPISHPQRRSTPYFDTTPVVAAATFAIVLLLSVHHYVNGRAQAMEEAKTRAALAPAPQNRTLAQAPTTYVLGSVPPQRTALAPSPNPNQFPQLPTEQLPSSPMAPMNQPPSVAAPNNNQRNWINVPTGGGGRVRANVPSFPPIELGAPTPPPTRRSNPADSQPAVPNRAATNDSAIAANPTTGGGDQGFIRVNVSKAKSGGNRPEDKPGNSTGESGSTEPPRAASHERIANQLFLQGDLDGAIDSYRRALEATSAEMTGPLHQQLAGAFLRKKQTAEAVAEYRRALEAYRLQKNANLQVSQAEKGIRACQDAINTWEPLIR